MHDFLGDETLELVEPDDNEDNETPEDLGDSEILPSVNVILPRKGESFCGALSAEDLGFSLNVWVLTRGSFGDPNGCFLINDSGLELMFSVLPDP